MRCTSNRVMSREIKNSLLCFSQPTQNSNVLFQPITILATGIKSPIHNLMKLVQQARMLQSNHTLNSSFASQGWLQDFFGFLSAQVGRQTLHLRFTPIANGTLQLRYCFPSLSQCFHTRKLEQKTRHDIDGDDLGEFLDVFQLGLVKPEFEPTT